LRKQLSYLFAAALLVLGQVNVAVAQSNSMPIIRDAEIESIIKGYARPIWKAAGLDPDFVQIHLIASRELNAFASDGQQMFFFTALLEQVRSPNELIGVIAHETGHIAGGHLARPDEGQTNAMRTLIASLLVGAAAAAAGAPDAGAAIMASSSDFATRVYFKFSRTQESAADQAGMKFLEAAHESCRGLISFLRYLGDQEALLVRNQDPYVTDHPLTPERLAHLEDVAHASPYYNTPDTPQQIDEFKRMQAKLRGFLDPVPRVMQEYPLSDTSLYARYARAVAYHRSARLDKAMTEVDSLVQQEPENPYFRELQGQILLESGKIKESIEPLRHCVELAPKQSLLQTLLGTALVQSGDDALNKEAIDHLKIATRLEPDNQEAWYQLAAAYTHAKMSGEADLATAENYLLTGRTSEAAYVAGRAARALPKGSPAQIRAMDITSVVQANMSKKDRRRQLGPLEQAQAEAKAQAASANRQFYFEPTPAWQTQDVQGNGPQLRPDLPQTPDSMRYHGAPVPYWDR
jgi:predicted Zn-dependent protease